MINRGGLQPITHIPRAIEFGEPAVIRIINAGLSLHSLHIHANHVYVTGVNGVVPTEGLNTHFPKKGTKSGDIDISVQLSPICYPMHDHSETSQSAQSGNYGMGVMSGLDFIGDRNTPGGVTTFPGAGMRNGPYNTGPASGHEGQH